MQKEKINGVLGWSAPKNIKEMQKFLGLTNYYRQFIKDFTRIAVPLYQLIRKKKKWRQKKEQIEAFKRLKKVFTTEPVLAISNPDKKMRMEANTLDYTTERVLLVKYRDKKWRPVAFISKSLNATEHNYKIHDKEMLAVI